MKRPIPPSHFKTKDDTVREDLRRIRAYLEQLTAWVADISANAGTGDLTQAAADLLYLLRAANDFNTFPPKVTPTGSDLVLLEDAADSGNKKYASLYAIQSPLVGFDVAVDINPLHWWRGDNTVQSGGLVDTIVDNGLSPKNFVQTGAARCPTAVDGNGQTYLALDGAADFYQAGAVADWKFLNDGRPWTIALIFQRTALISALEVILDTTDTTTGSTGVFVVLQFQSSTVQGPQCTITRSTASVDVQITNSFIPNTNLQVLVVRHKGQSLAVTAGVTDIPVDMRMSRDGFEVSTCTNNGGAAYNNVNPSFTLTLGRRSSTAASFTASRIYDVIVDNRCWSHRMLLGFEDYARSKGVVAI